MCYGNMVWHVFDKTAFDGHLMGALTWKPTAASISVFGSSGSQSW